MNKQNMLTERDVSVVIPTFNRSKDVKITLDYLKSFPELKEIIVVDQSTNNKTRKVCTNYKNVKCVFSKPPSITIARNLGVKIASKKSKIICFIDDDVSLWENYFEGILKIFNIYPRALGVAGKNDSGKERGFERYFKKLFYISHLEKEDRARIISAYGNTYPLDLNKVINSEWLPGVNMVFKREVFDKQSFDENLLGYTIVEDIDFTYRLYKRSPKSLFITPFAQLKHRCSKAGRYPTSKMSYINQIDHFYFNFKNLNRNFKDKAIFAWSLFGITLLRTLNFIFKPSKMNYLKLRYFLSSLIYCLINIDKIKKGKLREFKVK